MFIALIGLNILKCYYIKKYLILRLYLFLFSKIYIFLFTMITKIKNFLYFNSYFYYYIIYFLKRLYF